MKRKKWLFLILFLIFWSGSIRYAMLPKVTAEKPSSGIIDCSVNMDSVRIENEKFYEISMPEALTEKLQIEKWYPDQWSCIQAGDALCQIQEKSGNNALQQAKKRQAETLQQLENNKQIVSENVNRNTALEYLEEQIQQSEKEVEYLTQLQNDQWIIKSSQSGYLLDSGKERNETICGGDHLVSIIPEEEPCTLSMYSSEINHSFDIYSVIAYEKDGYSIKGKILATEYDHIVAQFDEIPIQNEEIVNQFTLSTEWNTTLIPSYCLLNDNSVFVVDNIDGWFGKENHIRQVPIEIAGIQSDWIIVSGGLFKDNKVVTYTDRELMDGMEVWLKQ